MKKTKQVRFINGFSESAWKSLVVKALRVGWPSALEAASQVLSRSTMNSLLLAGLFEDVWPSSIEELDRQYHLILDRSYEELCKYQTHHGRGYTKQFFDLAERACLAKEKPSVMHEPLTKIYSRTNIPFIPPRVNNCVWTWYYVEPQDKNPGRTIIDQEFTSMPECILDAHTYERKVRVGLLSGHYENHLKIGIEVQENGWSRIRKHLLTQESYPVSSIQKELF